MSFDDSSAKPPVPPPEHVASALRDLNDATERNSIPWALIGGQALIAHNIIRETSDVDAFAQHERLTDLAVTLVDEYHWQPIGHTRENPKKYVPVAEPTVHFMNDPVLFDMQQEREMIPLHSPQGVLVEILAAQHRVEQDMIDEAMPRQLNGVRIPVAPLGGILFVKTKADRTKDHAAFKEIAPQLDQAQCARALAWAQKRDHFTAEDLRSTLQASGAEVPELRSRSRRDPHER